jgi:hypothetical protein
MCQNCTGSIRNALVDETKRYAIKFRHIHKRMNKNHNPAFLDVKKVMVMNFTCFSHPNA